MFRWYELVGLVGLVGFVGSVGLVDGLVGWDRMVGLEEGPNELPYIHE